jgi:hypothetical protein
LIEVAKAVIPKMILTKLLVIQKYLLMIDLFKEIKAEKVPTAKTTKAINDFR